MLYRIVTICFFCCTSLSVISQENFYSLDALQEVRISFEEPNWDQILDSFYIEGQKERLLGTVSINGIAFDSVGIRYKGFSSVSVNRVKNPFNIKLDYVRNQSYQGIDKIKLGNVIHDPSFVREALSYEIARKYLPASESNFANVYVNDNFLGVYSNVEAVNKEFIAKHFNSNQNAFFKGNPEELEFNGENSNLSDTPGLDTSGYTKLYDIESETGWQDLVDFIQVLNNDTENVAEYLNIDRALWMHAFNYTLVNFDSYIGFAQNYYLYQDDYGLFNTIPWDLNMSFGSFRISDASDYFDGFSIDQAKLMDPLAHYNSFSVQPRPLMRKLFENDTYRRMYLAHIRTIVEENFSNGQYLERAETIQAVIEEDVLLDDNKFYSDASFKSNLSSTYSDFIDYPGLADLMDSRSAYLLDYPGIKQKPNPEIIDQVEFVVPGETIGFRVDSPECDRVYLFYRYEDGAPYQMKPLSAFTVGVLTTSLEMTDEVLQYYFYCENDEAGIFLPERAAYEYYTISPDVTNKLSYNDIVINEFMATQDSQQADAADEFDDWIELYNTTAQDISLKGMYLSDNKTQPAKWALPDTLIRAGEFKIVWADEDGSQGPMHANFKLSSAGEFISLGYADGTIVDTISFGEQESNITTGRLPNGDGPFVKLQPSFQSVNSVSEVKDSWSENLVRIFPNPVGEQLNIWFEKPTPTRISVYTIDGSLIKQFYSDKVENELAVDDYLPGTYFLQLIFNEQLLTHRFIKF